MLVSAAALARPKLSSALKKDLRIDAYLGSFTYTEILSTTKLAAGVFDSSSNCESTLKQRGITLEWEVESATSKILSVRAGLATVQFLAA